MRLDVSPPAIVREATDTLEALATRCNAAHEACEKYQRLSEEKARERAAALLEARDRCQREGIAWHAWIEANLTLSVRRCQELIKDSERAQCADSARNGQTREEIRGDEPTTEQPPMNKRKPSKAPRNVQDTPEQEQAPEVATEVPAPVQEPAKPREGHCRECGRAYPASVVPPPSTNRAAGLVKRIDLPKDQQCGKCQRTGLSSVCLNGCWKKALAWTEKNGH